MKEKLNREFLDLRRFENPINSIDLIKSITSNQNIENDPFYIVDLEDICNKHINWITRLPRVEPHYAVKCNTDSMLVKLLAFLGAGFDCASKQEIQRVLDVGVAPHRIIFANPCKQASYIKYAYKMGVDTMTFDNELELYKIKEQHPNAKCVLRIITNDVNATCRFSMKFGADMATSLKLIETAVSLDLDLVGVSFHVGSGQMSPEAFSESIANARQLFDYARETFNCRMHLLDLGGGYPGSSDSGDLFNAIAKEINHALETHFPVDYFDELNGREEKKLRIIAEPGRYYACSAFTLAVNVIAKRVMNQTAQQQEVDKEALCGRPAGDQILVNESNGPHYYSPQTEVDHAKSMMYYINDGVYASFNCLFYDHAEVAPILIGDKADKVFKSSIWGPTCDGLDVVVKECFLPDLTTGEFMIFKNMGAYTLSGAVPFNGIPLPRCIYVASTSWETIKEAFTEPADEPLVNTLLSGANSTANTTTCAAAATLAFSRALSSIQQQLEHTELIGRDDFQHLHHLDAGKCGGDVDAADQLDLSDDATATAPVDCAITC